MNITEAGKQTSLTPNTLRYYERIGLIPPVARNKAEPGIHFQRPLLDRIYKNHAVSRFLPGNFDRICRLVTARRHLVGSRKDILELQREVLQEKLEFIQQTLARIDIKIENYRTDIYQKNHPLQNQKQEEADL